MGSKAMRAGGAPASAATGRASLLPLPAALRSASRPVRPAPPRFRRRTDLSSGDETPSRADLERWEADYPPVDGSLSPPEERRGASGEGGAFGAPRGPYRGPPVLSNESSRWSSVEGGRGRLGGVARVQGAAMDSFPRGDAFRSPPSFVPPGVPQAAPLPQGYPPPSPQLPATPPLDVSEALLRGSDQQRAHRRARRVRGERERVAAAGKGFVEAGEAATAGGGGVVDVGEEALGGDGGSAEATALGLSGPSPPEGPAPADPPRPRASWWRLALPFPLPFGIGVPSTRYHLEGGRSGADRGAAGGAGSPTGLARPEAPSGRTSSFPPLNPLRRLLFDRRWRERQAERLRSHPIWFQSAQGGESAELASAEGGGRAGAPEPSYASPAYSAAALRAGRSLPASVRPSSLGNGTFALLLVNLLLAVLRSLSLPSSAFLDRLALLHWDPRPWQLVTASFCHASWGHLASNAFGLLVFGKAVEEEVGGLGVVLCYLVCGAGGLGASLLASPGAPTASLGASASVFGLFAVATLLKLRWSLRSLLEASILGSFAFEQIDHELRELADAQRAAGGVRGLTGRLAGRGAAAAAASSVRVAHGAHVAGAALGALVAVAYIRARRGEPRSGAKGGGGLLGWLWRIVW